MNLEQLLAMPAQERDALVAEKVMGWRVHPRNTAHWMEKDADLCDYRVMGQTSWLDRWAPSTNIAADYAVLVRVRKTLTPRQLTQMADILTDIWNGRGYKGESVTSLLLEYQPGDYALAALLALDSPP